MVSSRSIYCILTVLLVIIGTASWIKNAAADELIVGTSTDYPPYYFEVDGSMEGLCVDIINETAKTLGITVVYRQYPWKRMLHYGKTGKVDAAMPLFRTLEREIFLYFFQNELAVEEKQFFIKKSRSIHYTGDLHQLQPNLIGIVDDYSYGPAFDAADFLNKVLVKNDGHLLELFARDLFDLGLGNRQVILYHANRTGITDRILFLKSSVTKNPLYIGFSKAWKTLDKARAFSAALTTLKDSSFYVNLLKRYSLD